MSNRTPEQVAISEVKDDISSIRQHLKTIKERQDSDDFSKIEFNRKIDLIVNSLTDTDFNGKNGLLTRFGNVETKVIVQDLYWKIIGFLLIPIYTGMVAVLFKIYNK